MKQIKEILIASVSLFLLGFGICMAVSNGDCSGVPFAAWVWYLYGSWDVSHV